MISRSLIAGVLAVVALAACDKQPAGPAVTNANTASIIVSVQNDRSLSPSAVTFATDSGGTRIDLVDRATGRIVQSTTTDRTGRAAFVGLNPGTYEARLNRAFANDSTTVIGPSAIPITVSAGQTETSTVFRTRLGSRIIGSIKDTVITTSGARRFIFAGVPVYIYRQTGTIPNPDPTKPAIPVFAGEAFDTVTTDAAGNFSIPVAATAAAYQLRFTPGVTAGQSDSLRLGGSLTGATLGEQAVVVRTGVNTNTTVSLNQLYQLPAKITGTAFRDLNNDGVKAATGENLVTGDDVRLFLRADSATGRVVALATANVTTGAYTFASVAPGTYYVTMDLVNSRFPSNPLAFTRSPAVMVTVPNSNATVTANVPIPYGP